MCQLIWELNCNSGAEDPDHKEYLNSISRRKQKKEKRSDEQLFTEVKRGKWEHKKSNKSKQKGTRQI